MLLTHLAFGGGESPQVLFRELGTSSGHTQPTSANSSMQGLSLPWTNRAFLEVLMGLHSYIQQHWGWGCWEMQCQGLNQGKVHANH